MPSLHHRTVSATLATEFACRHEKTRRVRRVYASGVERFWVQCLACGAGVRALPRKEILNVYVLPAFDEGLAKAWEERQAERRVELAEVRQAEWREGYQRYLESADWQRLRQLVFERAGGKCEGCRERPPAEVHHLTYERVGHEMLFDLVAVCRPCHRKITRWARERK